MDSRQSAADVSSRSDQVVAIGLENSNRQNVTNRLVHVKILPPLHSRRTAGPSPLSRSSDAFNLPALKERAGLP